MRESSIDVVIPTFDRRDLIASCLDHLRRQSASHRPIVVDDGSSDGTEEMLAESFPEATVVRFSSNRGFTRAVNAGVRAGTAELVVLLNNDVDCRPTFVERLVAPLRSEGEVGMVAALLLQADGQTIDSLGLEVDSTLAPFPRHWGAAPAEADLTDPSGLLGPVGGAAAFRRSALEEVGGLDESIFGYGEDVDLALRLRAAGWSCALAPDAVGVHLGSASFGRHSSGQVYHRGWSRAYLLRKYGLGLNPRAWLGELSSVLWQLAVSRDAAGLRGRIDGWRAGRRRLRVPAGATNRGLTIAETIARRRRYRA